MDWDSLDIGQSGNTTTTQSGGLASKIPHHDKDKVKKDKTTGMLIKIITNGENLDPLCYTIGQQSRLVLIKLHFFILSAYTYICMTCIRKQKH